MSQTTILAVGLDSSLLANRHSMWQSAEYFITSVGSIREAILHFKNGDFDLILLGHSIPAESRERLTFVIRAYGSRIPVVCITDRSGHQGSFADAAIKNRPNDVIEGIGEFFGETDDDSCGNDTHAKMTGRCALC